MEFKLSMPPEELGKLISKAVEIGIQKGQEMTADRSKYMSQNKAFRLYGKGRVRKWVDAGLIAPRTGGNGRNSTIYYETATLMIIDASNRISVQKSEPVEYNANNHNW
jgi:hypothetical protein